MGIYIILLPPFICSACKGEDFICNNVVFIVAKDILFCLSCSQIWLTSPLASGWMITSSPTCSQIWVSPLVGDHQSTYLPDKQNWEETQKHNPNSDQMPPFVASGNLVFICKKIEAH